jgi:HicA toxin of bacterial toxin-antitoxin,
MSKREKAVSRLLSRPSDFGWDELRALMESFGYELKATGGSGRKFIDAKTKATLFLHEPHPGKILKAYQVRETLQFLRQERRIP